MNMNMSNTSTTAVADVLRDSHVFITSQPLGLMDSGKCHRHLLVLQIAAAAKVSGGKKTVNIFLNGAHTPSNR